MLINRAGIGYACWVVVVSLVSAWCTLAVILAVFFCP